MKTKEAIERVKARFNKWALDEEDLAALQTLGLVSEDEMIRKEIVDFICWAIDRGSITKEQRERSDTWLAYLECQKEHQNNSDAPNESSWEGAISSSDNGRNLDELAREYIDGVKQYHSTPTWDLMQTAVCYGYHLGEEVRSEGADSVKPAEWSEEEKGILLECISVLQNSSHWLLADRLSSIRPQHHWKPSEEQMRAVFDASERNDKLGSVLRNLYDDLKKL